MIVAAAVFPLLPPSKDWFMIEDGFEWPGLLLVALGALAGRQRLWPLASLGALAILGVDIAWRFGALGPVFPLLWTVGAVLVAAWACWPMREGLALRVSQILLAVATATWVAHGVFVAMGAPLPTTILAVVAVLAALGLTTVLRGLALRKAPTLL